MYFMNRSELINIFTDIKVKYNNHEVDDEERLEDIKKLVNEFTTHDFERPLFK